MLRFFAWIVVALVLSHCASKHQPIAFSPYFQSRPESYFGTEGSVEMRQLEQQAETQPLAPYDRKRLLELYIAEQRPLKASTARYAELDEKIKRLKTDLAELEKQNSEVASELKKMPLEKSVTEKVVNPMKTSPRKKEYNEVVSLWNKDDTAGALAKLDEFERTIFSSLTNPELIKFLNVRFRVALEIGNTQLATQAYEKMRAVNDCDVDVTQAGFLLSLVSFSAGDAKTALQLFKAQCDSDKSTANLIRRKYWVARFTEGQGGMSPEAKALYEEVSKTRLPGYHTFMASQRLGQTIVLPLTASPGNPLAPEFSVPSAVHEALLAAEERLKSNLRREASLHLQKASRILRQSIDQDYLPAMLYTAHLFHAAGNHLESMKLYTDVTNSFLDAEILESFVTPELFTEMFPRPFQNKVDWLSKMWGVDPDFVYSIVRQESAFNPAAVSVADARGLMQLMPFLAKSLARQWNFTDYYSDKILFHAEENLKLGVFHLNQLQRVAPHPALMAAAYNAGISRVMNWWRRYGQYPLDIFVEFIPINETRYYVKYVLRNLYFYKALRNGGKVDPKAVPSGMGQFPQSVALHH